MLVLSFPCECSILNYSNFLLRSITALLLTFFVKLFISFYLGRIIGSFLCFLTAITFCSPSVLSFRLYTLILLYLTLWLYSFFLSCSYLFKIFLSLCLRHNSDIIPFILLNCFFCTRESIYTNSELQLIWLSETRRTCFPTERQP